MPSKERIASDVCTDVDESSESPSFNCFWRQASWSSPVTSPVRWLNTYHTSLSRSAGKADLGDSWRMELAGWQAMLLAGADSRD